MQSIVQFLIFMLSIAWIFRKESFEGFNSPLNQSIIHLESLNQILNCVKFELICSGRH